MSGTEKQETAAGNSPIDPGFLIRQTSWALDQAALRAVRQQVFVEEQEVPATLEWDTLDADAVHLLAVSTPDDKAIGTARLVSSTGQIGRMAVVADWRHRGVGRALLLRLMRIARERDLPTPWLNAQTSALNFYAGLGFSVEGEIFDDAGIPHRRMLLTEPG